ncbi:MAG: Lcl C-terminal domain-containing protein [Gammaproteobacteria bacterium]
MIKKLLLTTLCFYAVVAQAANEGVLESVSCDVIKGWAWDSAQPNAQIRVKIFNGTSKIATVTAKRFRQDLLDAGIGNGEHGFVYRFGAELKNGKTHKISVKFADTTTYLTGSPKTTAVCVGALNDSGWQKCGDYSQNDLSCPVSGYEGQDGDYGRDAKARIGTLKKKGSGLAGFDFTKIANNGTKLPETAAIGAGPKDWACTLDNVTGLLWEVKTNDNGLRHATHTYSWYNPDSNTNGGDVGIKNGGTCGGGISCDTQGYTLAINAQGLCGKKDWRIPTLEELRSLASYDTTSNYIDSVYFPNIQRYDYWSATPYADFISYAWEFNVFHTQERAVYKGNPYAVRLVRGGK